MNTGDEWDNMLDNLGLGDTHPPEAPPEPPPAEEAPRGRGRRRTSEDAPKRRRRSAKPEAKEGPPMTVDEFSGGIISEIEVVQNDESGPFAEGEDAEPRKRRRRRSRRKKTGAEGAPAAEGEAVVAEAADDDSEPVDVAPIENYASLNIPSWQELIDGLYKP